MTLSETQYAAVVVRLDALSNRLDAVELRSKVQRRWGSEPHGDAEDRAMVLAAMTSAEKREWIRRGKLLLKWSDQLTELENELSVRSSHLGIDIQRWIDEKSWTALRREDR